MMIYIAIPVSIFVIFTNVIVFLAIIKSKKLQKLKNVPLVGLATADILVGVFWIPFATALEYFPGNKTICRAALSCEVFTMHASLFNLIAVSVERWTAIFKPLHYHSIANRSTVIAILGSAWFTSMLLLIVFQIQYIEVDVKDATECEVVYRSQVWFLSIIFVVFYSVCALMFFMQRKIFIVIRYHMARIRPISLPRKHGTVTKFDTDFAAEKSVKENGASSNELYIDGSTDINIAKDTVKFTKHRGINIMKQESNEEKPTADKSCFIYHPQNLINRTVADCNSQNQTEKRVISSQSIVVKPASKPKLGCLIETNGLNSDAYKQLGAIRIRNFKGNNTTSDNHGQRYMNTENKWLENTGELSQTFYDHNSIQNQEMLREVTTREMVRNLEYSEGGKGTSPEESYKNIERYKNHEDTDSFENLQKNEVINNGKIELESLSSSRGSTEKAKGILESKVYNIHATESLIEDIGAARTKCVQERKRNARAVPGNVGKAVNRSEESEISTSGHIYVSGHNSDIVEDSEKQRQRKLTIVKKFNQKRHPKSKASLIKMLNSFKRHQESNGFARAMATNIVCLFFVIMWAPKTTIDLLISIGYCKSCSVVYPFPAVLAWLNSGVNALIYAWRMEEFRETIIRMFSRKRKRTISTRSSQSQNINRLNMGPTS